MYLDNKDNRILLAFLTVSLLLHLLLLLLVPELSLLPKPDSSEPVYVEMRPSVQPRELDLPKEKDQPREIPAKRLGPSDRVVKKEIAPKGDALEESAPTPTLPSPPPPRPAQPADSGDKGESMVPDLAKLMRLPSATVSRIDDQLRQKYREEVEEGESIWLDTEKDILISFYQRLRNGIYQVWNYPVKSRDRGEEGNCLIRMTFNRDGTVKDVELLESSGFPRLDREAVAAVYKGAPYGKLPDAYKKEEISILAFFRYTINRVYISN